MIYTGFAQLRPHVILSASSKSYKKSLPHASLNLQLMSYTTIITKHFKL